MPFLEILGGLSAASGLLGNLFGSGQETTLPPQLEHLFATLEQRSKEGIATDEENRLLQQLTQRLGNEFGALSSLTSQRLQQQGAGTGVQQAARDQLSKQRFNALGEGIGRISALDEAAKSGALSQMSSLAGILPSFTTDTGAGFASLFGSGVDLLLSQTLQDDNKKLLKSITGGNESGQYRPPYLAGMKSLLYRPSYLAGTKSFLGTKGSNPIDR